VFPQSSGSALGTAGFAVYALILIYTWMIIIRVFLTWFSANENAPFVRFLRKFTDPALNFTKRHIPLTLGGIDFSPVILIALLYFLMNLVLMGSRTIGAGASPWILLPLICLCLLRLVISLVFFLMLLLILRVILSLVAPSPYNFLVLIVYGATEPLLAPLRGLLPRGPHGLDLRALLLLAFLFLFHAFVLQNLIGLVFKWAMEYGARPL
jgi:YggT family protein